MAFGRDTRYAATEEGLFISGDHGLVEFCFPRPRLPAAVTALFLRHLSALSASASSNFYLWALTPGG
jgi:hypothetical protein